MLDYAWLVLLFPLAGVLSNAILGRWLGRRAVAIIASLAVAAAFLVAVLVFFEMLSLPAEAPDGSNGRRRIIPLFTWLVSGDYVIQASILLDQLSVLMILVVTGVSALIHVYSAGYMAEDQYHNRYFTWLNLFVFMMLVLVLANGFVTMYIGWEGVGLCSYLLIGYWFERDVAAEAGKKAFIVNRVGDFGFLVAILLIFATFGSVAFQDVLPAAGTLLPATATAIALLLFVGAIAKSAQIPLHVWLPDAMEGPTPVSALIHAATMVTAGVYLIARCHTLFEASPSALKGVIWIGALTAFFAATVAAVQKDLKRVLAYSTISQLGYMFLGVGAGAYAAGMFHLTTHAYFKALLFLCAGSVMHALAGELDIFRMGGLRKKMPWTFGTFLIGVLALAGVPFLSGFFSKDEILVNVFEYDLILPWVLGLVAAGLTALYAFRLLFVTFYGRSRMDKKTEKQIRESPPIMLVPLVILAALAAMGGYIGLPRVLGVGSAIDGFLEPVFADSIIPQPTHGVATTEVTLIGVATLAVAVGFLTAYWLYVRRWGLAERLTKQARWLYDLLFNAYYMDEAYNEVVVSPLRSLAGILADVVEVRGIDGMVHGLARVTGLAGERIRRLQTGLVRNYALATLAGVVALLAYLLLRGWLKW
jgi:NADH-quinone oxidoreductase subunit L